MKKFITYILPFLSFLFSDQIYKISIEGTIDLGLPPYIERSIKEAEANGASAIIFEINTFGGRVDAATQIKDAILGTEILSVAYINRRAISAGALISLSCEKIYMSGGGLIGAATAVDMSGKKGSEKVISFMREEMASTAEKRGRNKEIARGMVDEELKFSFLLINGDSIKVEDIEGRKEGKLISLTTEQALKYKIADNTVENIDELIEDLGYSLDNVSIVSSNENWSEDIVRFLTNPVVSSLLTTFGFLGILFELQSPGWGIPGIVGLTCLILSLSTSYIAKLATVSDLIYMFSGISLVILEVLVIPGFGIVGIAGFFLILYSLYLLLIPDIPVGGEVLDQAMDGFTIGIVGAIIGLYFFGKMMLKTKFWKDLTSPYSQKKEDGFTNSFGWETFVGEKGVTDTDLRPSGWIVIKDKRLFALTEGTFIEKGVSVEILSVEGNRIVVRETNN